MEKQSQRILFQFDDFKQAIGPLTFLVKGHRKVRIFLWQIFIYVPSLVEKGEKLSELEG